MQERPAQIVLLARSFEEVDRAGRLLSVDERNAATRHALMVTTLRGERGQFPAYIGIVPADETLVRRARLIFNVLYRKIPALYRILEFSRFRSLMAPLVVGGALLAGLSVNMLDPAGRVRLPSWPLLLLLAWNLPAYLIILGAKLAQPTWERIVSRREWVGRHPLATGLAGQVVRLSLWRSRFGWRQKIRATPEQTKITSRSFVRFCALWLRLAGRLLQMRVRRMMHLGALAMSTGVLVGIYVRCIAFDYRATWEGSWLPVETLERLVSVVFWPAATLLGTTIPEIGAIYTSRAQAETWLQLHAWTWLIFLLLPRLVMLIYTALRCRKLAADLPLDIEETYYRRVLAR